MLHQDLRGGGPGGCIVACGLPAEAYRIPELKTKLAGLLASSDGALTRRMRQAQQAGELAADADVEILGALLVNATLAMSLRSRAGATEAQLRRHADGLVALICGPAGPGRPIPNTDALPPAPRRPHRPRFLRDG